ncbi:SprT-like protease [Mycobacterium phage Gail]|uniref:SprT-like protease n=1 Tax=Mycobacterium phage Gail TaxID=2743994 RepID=A0A7D5FTI9_9CAUD|nr:SprT-like protease [Mycobacterium phage Gail]QLF84648.1 SprT-like protease [Mycobacterium phage Gail]
MNHTMTQVEARRIAQNLLVEHGLAAFGWKVGFDHAKKRAGQCNYRTQTISLSRYVMAQRSYAETMNTITHEVAHALTQGHHHDAVWARKHRELGGDGKRCYTREGIDENAPWIAVCGHGKALAAYYRKPKRLHGWSCRCPGGAAPITWQDNRRAA